MFDIEVTDTAGNEELPVPNTSPQAVNLKPILTVSDSTPEEAVDNINLATKLDISPEGVKQTRPYLVAQLDKDKIPELSNKVAIQEISKSGEHAAAMKDDVEHLNAFDKTVGYLLDTLKGKDVYRELMGLRQKQLMGEPLNYEEKVNASRLTSQVKEINDHRERYNISPVSGTSSEFVGMIYDMYLGLKQNSKATVAGAIAGGAQGALGGFVTPVPGGTLLGGAIGTLYGAYVGTGIGLVLDAYDQSSAQVYDTLLRDLKAQPGKEQVTENERKFLAKGAGVVTSAISLIPLHLVPKNINWLNNLLTKPKGFVEIVEKSPMWKDFLVAVGKSSLVGGVSSGLQKSTEILSEELGKTFDGTETHFMAAISESVSRWEEVVKSAGMGAAGAGALTAVGHAAGAPFRRPPEGPRFKDVGSSGPGDGGGGNGPTRFKDVGSSGPGDGGGGNGPTRFMSAPKPPGSPESRLPIIIKGVEAIQFKTALEHASKTTKSTNAAKYLPDSINKIRQSLFDDVGMSHVSLDKKDLNAWADSEEKAKKVRDMLGPKGFGEAALNAPLRVEAYKFLKLMDDHPEVVEFAKKDPDGLSAKQFMDKVKEAEASRAAIQAEKPAATSSDLVTEHRRIDDAIFTRDEYLTQPTFTDKMYEALPKGTADKINTAQFEARAEVGEAIHADFEKHMEKVAGLQTEFQLLFEREVAIDKLANNKKIHVVEDYMNNNRAIGELTPDQIARKDKKFPVHAINPVSLTTRQRSKFLDDPTLKSRKVFSKKGQPINEVFPLYGAKSASEFLTMLSETPTREQAISAAVEARRESVEIEAKTNSDFDHSRLSKAYNNMSKNHLKELKIILDQHRSTFKKTAMLMFNMPKIEELQVRAKNAVGNTRVRDLNAAQWKVAERRSYKNYLKAVLDNKLEVAFRELENAAYATQLAKESHIAIGKANHAFKWIAKRKSAEVRNTLKDAGPLYSNAINSILDVYNFDPSQKDQSIIDAYGKFVEKMATTGNGDFSIPPEVLEWLTPAKSAEELTVDQTLYLYDKMKGVMHMARIKNKFMNNYVKLVQGVSVDMIASTAEKLAKDHPKYDPNKALVRQDIVPWTTRQANKMIIGGNFINNTQFIVRELDKGNLTGFWSEMILQPMLGTGNYEGPYGLSAETKLHVAIREKWTKAIKKYGSEFKYLGMRKVHVPEFVGKGGLSSGNVTKLDLMMMIPHLGNEENRAALENFGLPTEDIIKILERELTVKDFDFIKENVWDFYKDTKPRLAALQKVTRGEDIVFTTPMSFVAFGKVYEGGHAPIKYKKDTGKEAVEQMNNEISELADPNNDKTIAPHPAFNGFVRSPHTKLRTGSNWEVDLDFNTINRGFSEVIRDLTMSVPIRDVVKFLKNKSVGNGIASVVGYQRYKTLLHHVAKETKSIAAEGLLFDDAQRQIYGLVNSITSAVSVATIAYNPASILISSNSMVQVAANMGLKNFTKYIGKASAKFTEALATGKYGDIIKLAKEIDASIYKHGYGLDEFSATPLVNLDPKKRALKLKPYYWLRQSQESLERLAFDGILGGIDNGMKELTAIAGYLQFINGDVPNFPIEKIQRMKHEEVDLAAKAYSQRLISTSLMAAGSFDKGAMQHIKGLKPWVMYFNEGRSALGNLLQDRRNFENNTIEMIKNSKTGNYEDTFKAGRENADMLMRRVTLAMITLMITAIARNQNPTLTDEEKEGSTKLFGPGAPLSPGKTASRVPKYVVSTLTTPKGLYKLGENTVLGSAPMARDMIFGADTGKGVSNPLMGALTDTSATVFKITPQVINDILDGLTILEATENLTDQQIRQVENSIAFALRLPLNAALRFDNYFKDPEMDESVLPFVDNYKKAAKLIEKFIDKHDTPLTLDEKIKLIGDKANGRNSEMTPMRQLVEELKTVQEMIAPTDQGALPATDYEYIKFRESNNEWDARPPGAGPRGAFGIWQFTESTWKRVMNMPEGVAAGLTEEGRTLKSARQQNIAMKILTADNARVLRNNGVPVNVYTIYFAHHFGPGKAKEVYLNKDNHILSKGDNGLLSPKVLRNNPWLTKYKVKTSGDMRKNIIRMINEGKKLYENSIKPIDQQEKIQQESVGDLNLD